MIMRFPEVGLALSRTAIALQLDLSETGSMKALNKLKDGPFLAI